MLGKLFGKSPKLPSWPGGPGGPGGPTTGSSFPPLPIISPKLVLGSPNSILSYLFLSTLKTVLITLAWVLILYLVSIIVTVSHKLILSSNPSYPIHLLRGIKSILKFCLGLSTLFILNSFLA